MTLRRSARRRRRQNANKNNASGDIAKIHRHRDGIAAGLTKRRRKDFNRQKLRVTAGTLLKSFWALAFMNLNLPLSHDFPDIVAKTDAATSLTDRKLFGSTPTNSFLTRSTRRTT